MSEPLEDNGPGDAEAASPASGRPQPPENPKPDESGDMTDAAAAASDREVDLPQDADDALGALQKDRDEVHSRLLRVSADYQNYVRRSKQNIDTARDQLLMDIAKELITVMDHFDRALQVDHDKTSAKSLLEGMQIVRDELLRALERFGIQRVNVRTGDAFDPMRHEALMRQAIEGVESDCVAAQLQPGYILGDKTVRPAQVTVAE